MSIPKPGRPVRGSRTGRPMMALLDLLGRRWALRVLWELRLGALTFRALRDACDAVSPTVLNQRLAELRDAGVIEHLGEGGYVLTTEGEALLAAMAPLHQWSERWAKREEKRRPSGARSIGSARVPKAPLAKT